MVTLAVELQKGPKEDQKNQTNVFHEFNSLTHSEAHEEVVFSLKYLPVLHTKLS